MLDVMAAMAPGGSSGGGSQGAPWLFFIVGPLAIIAGIAFMVKPKLQWKMNRWQYKNPAAMEPSAKGLVMIRVSGAFFAIIGAVLVFVAVTKR